MHLVVRHRAVGHESDAEFAAVRGREHHGDGAAHTRDALHREIDLLEIDAVAPDLDLIVHPSVEPETAPVVLAHEIAGPVTDRTVTVLPWILAEALRRLL